MSNLDLIRNKRHQFDNLLNFSSFSRKKHRSSVINSANLYIKPLGLPFISTTTGSSSESIRLQPYCPHTIGRTRQRCDTVFEDSRVSKTHCQVLFDAFNRKLILADGVLWSGSSECSRVRVSLNGVFVNGARIGRAEVAELDAGDEVSLVCANEGDCSLGVRIGFVVQKIVFVEEVCERNVSSFGANCRCSGYPVAGSQCSRDSVKVNFLLSQCRQILHSSDPIYCSRKSIISSNGLSSVLSNVKFPVEGALEPGNGAIVEMRVNQRLELGNANMVELGSIIHQREKSLPFKVNAAFACDNCDDNHIQRLQYGYPLANNVTNGKSEMMEMDSRVKEIASRFCGAVNDVNEGVSIPPPGRKFYLNRLQSMGNGGQHAVVSLPELFYPVGSLKQVFIATFTSDIPWFLAYCEIPVHLPVTIACHNRERCWSSIPDERIVMPCSDFPNLIVVYPPFPEVIAFGNDQKKSGIACHHPKLFVLQREDSIRIVITSANLVAKQWNSVTNTVWWQDFPRASIPDYLSLFTQLSMRNINQDIQSDFAAQLAGFMASLIADVPSQAHWILGLTKYDFKGAVGHLVASVPGIHSRRTPPIFVSMYLSPCASRAEIVKVLGSIETSVVGLSHLFRSSADSSGAQLKKLASFIGKCQENSNGMLEVVLRRNTNIPADVNAVSILVPNPKQFLVEDCVQLGFLPRAVAKWVAPLLDSGLFRFSGFVYPKEVLAAALEGSSSKVQMILYVSQGPSFSDLSKVDHAGHFSPICSLIASIQRSTGIWRLHEVLSHYKWPEYLETDFLFGSSSIGAVNAQFLAAFSAAAGKTSVQLSESEESDPDWGCWTASQELRNPSIRIIFPTIERVKNASCGILASKHILCFSQKTWQRLRNVGIVLDAIPYPSDRVNDPMHVKVARRRFQAKTDASSFGWVYCGSHNFSASAWGRPLFKPSGMMDDKAVKTNSILGSRLHICNYEVGIIFVVPPSDSKNMSLDDIVLPFVVPAPKYRPCDQPATPQAMREACLELREQERIALMDEAVAGELMEEEILEEEEEVLEATNYVAEEQEDEKAYAEALWSQVDSSESC